MGAELITVSCDTHFSHLAWQTVEKELKDVKFKYTGGDRGWVGDVPNFDYDLSKINALGWTANKSSDDAMRIAVRAEIARRKQEGKP